MVALAAGARAQDQGGGGRGGGEEGACLAAAVGAEGGGGGGIEANDVVFVKVTHGVLDNASCSFSLSTFVLMPLAVCPCVDFGVVCARAPLGEVRCVVRALRS